MRHSTMRFILVFAVCTTCGCCVNVADRVATSAERMERTIHRYVEHVAPIAGVTTATHTATGNAIKRLASEHARLAQEGTQ